MGVPRRPVKLPEGNSYNVGQYVFPPSLSWLKENQNYVAFYINMLEPENGSKNADLMDINDPVPGSTQGKSVFGISSNRSYKRVKDVIVLPIMERPAVTYSADFDTTSLGPVVGWLLTNGTAGSGSGINLSNLDAITSSAESLKKDFDKATGMLSDFAKAAAAGALNAILPNSIDGASQTSDIFSAIRKTAMNEHRTQVFRGMRFREFQFNYHFAPRDPKEAEIIRNIINLFKYHMHPDTANGNIFLTYPSEFEIVFYFQNEENAGVSDEKSNSSKAMFKISSCALTNFNVQYGGTPFTTFKDGMPSEIQMMLGFQELELLTKDRVAEGF